MIIKEKIIRKIFDVYQVCEDFMKFDDNFKKVRPDLYKCGGCDKKFQDGDNLNLASVRGKKNMLICDSCRENLAKNSVDTKFVKVKKNTGR